MSRIISQAGDTIIEVLICMAIASFSLGLAYGITRRASNDIRQAQERTEALKFTEEQIERLKEITSNPNYVVSNYNCSIGPLPITKPAIACLDGTFRFPKVPAISVTFGATASAIYSFCIDDSLNLVGPIGPTDVSSDTPVCKIDSKRLYRTGIFYQADPTVAGNPDNNFYFFGGRFTSIGKGGANTQGYDVANIMYRLHP